MIKIEFEIIHWWMAKWWCLNITVQRLGERDTIGSENLRRIRIGFRRQAARTASSRVGAPKWRNAARCPTWNTPRGRRCPARRARDRRYYRWSTPRGSSRTRNATRRSWGSPGSWRSSPSAAPPRAGWPAPAWPCRSTARPTRGASASARGPPRSTAP